MESELRFSDGQHVVIEKTEPDLVFRAWVPPKIAGPPAHRHGRETETFTVYEGRLLVRAGKTQRILQSGDSVSVPPGTTHTFSNPFDEPAQIGTVESPAGPLHAQLQVLAQTCGRPPVLKFAEINAEHGFSFTLAGVPDGLQRLGWRALAALARLR